MPSLPAPGTRRPRVVHLYVDETHVDEGLTLVGGLALEPDLDELGADLMAEPWARDLWATPHSRERVPAGDVPSGEANGGPGAGLAGFRAHAAEELLGAASRASLQHGRLFAVALEREGLDAHEAACRGDVVLLAHVLQALQLGQGAELRVHAEPRDDLDGPRRMAAYVRGLMAALACLVRPARGWPTLRAGRPAGRGSKAAPQLDVLGCGLVDHYLRALRPVLVPSTDQDWRAACDGRTNPASWGFHRAPELLAVPPAGQLPEFLRGSLEGEAREPSPPPPRPLRR